MSVKSYLILFIAASSLFLSMQFFGERKVAGIAHPSKAVAEVTASDFYLGGIQINEADDQVWVDQLATAGMNTVEVTVYATQGNWNDNNLWFEESNAGVINEIRQAKARGLKVVLILRVALDHSFPANEFLWHGMIFPENENHLKLWFDAYRRFASHWATIAEQEKVDILVIGSELNALVDTRQAPELSELLDYYISKKKRQAYRAQVMQFEKAVDATELWVKGRENYKNLGEYLDAKIKCNYDWANKAAFSYREKDQLYAINERRAILNWHWEELILALRGKYSGKMTFAANFDSYDKINFWKSLDFVGINAYFPLRNSAPENNSDSAMHKSLVLGWNKVLNEIESFKKDAKLEELPVFFTELGYGRGAASTLAPWQAAGFTIVEMQEKDSLVIWKNQAPNLVERKLAVDALYETVELRNFPLAGILYWKLTTHDYHLPYEPFAMQLANPPVDSLQNSLVKFMQFGQQDQIQAQH